MLTQLRKDARELMRAEAAAFAGRRPYLALLCDSFGVLVLQRAREWLRRLHVPLANRFLRRLQLALYGIDLGNHVRLGDGVSFVHTVGVVVGGTARVGSRVRFMGGNTVGTAKDDGYPVIEDDVMVGCGARILGPIRVGARAVIGANAVVLEDVPADAVAVGIPARWRPRPPAEGAPRDPVAIGMRRPKA